MINWYDFLITHDTGWRICDYGDHDGGGFGGWDSEGGYTPEVGHVHRADGREEQICTHNGSSKVGNCLYPISMTSIANGERGGTWRGGTFSAVAEPSQTQSNSQTAPGRGHGRERGQARRGIRRALARELSWFMMLVLFWSMISDTWYEVCDMN